MTRDLVAEAAECHLIILPLFLLLLRELQVERIVVKVLFDMLACSEVKDTSNSSVRGGVIMKRIQIADFIKILSVFMAYNSMLPCSLNI